MRYLNIICAMKQNKKKSFLSSKGNFGTTFFILSLSGNVLKFAINVGGWKQDTHDTYIKDLKPIKEAMIYVTATTVVVVC